MFERDPNEEQALGMKKLPDEIVDLHAKEERQQQAREERINRILDEKGTNEEGGKVNIGTNPGATMEDVFAMTKAIRARLDKYKAINADPNTDEVTRARNEQSIKTLEKELDPHRESEDLDIAA